MSSETERSAKTATKRRIKRHISHRESETMCNVRLVSQSQHQCCVNSTTSHYHYTVTVAASESRMSQGVGCREVTGVTF